MSFKDAEYQAIEVGDTLYRVEYRKDGDSLNAPWRIGWYEVVKIVWDEHGKTLWVTRQSWDTSNSYPERSLNKKLIKVSDFTNNFFTTNSAAALCIREKITKALKDWDDSLRIWKVEVPGES